VHVMAAGTVITNSVTSPADSTNGTRHICAGWTGTGDVPATGGTASATFALSQNSILTWQWSAEHMLTLGGIRGAVTGDTAGFKAEGSAMTLYPKPNKNCRFLYWTINGVASGSAIPLNLAMDAPKSVAAVCANKAHNDYNGDGKSDLTLFDPATGRWHIFSLSKYYQWGFPGAAPLQGDYDGDRIADLAVYESATGRWYIWSVAKKQQLVAGVQWGFSGCMPVSGDYDGDSRDDLCVYDTKTGNWYIQSLYTNKPLAMATNWGFPGCTPLNGDYDGDGRDDLAVYDRTSGKWYVRTLEGKKPIVSGITWGFTGCEPVPADYDGDGRVDPAVYDTKKGNWHMLTGTGIIQLNWGFPGCIPVPGNYFIDATDDPAVYDPSAGLWYILNRENPAKSRVGVDWSKPGAIPVR
jgi:hypothetical protein